VRKDRARSPMTRCIVKTCAACLAVSVAFIGAILAGWDSYVPRTLESVIDANRSKLSGDVTFTASSFPSRATMVYQGKIQPIPAPRLKFLEEYLGKFRGRPDWVSKYANEVLCRERQSDYWLPIQSGVLEYFKNEVPPGATVELFVTWLGAQRSGDQVDWLFSINEFQVPKGESK
jgi:hypothetical protein